MKKSERGVERERQEKWRKSDAEDVAEGEGKSVAVVFWIGIVWPTDAIRLIHFVGRSMERKWPVGIESSEEKANWGTAKKKYESQTKKVHKVTLELRSSRQNAVSGHFRVCLLAAGWLANVWAPSIDWSVEADGGDGGDGRDGRVKRRIKTKLKKYTS